MENNKITSSESGLSRDVPGEGPMYYIQNGYVGNAVMWWATNRSGYVTDIRQAGRYTEEQMKDITKRPQDIGWPCEYVDALGMPARKEIIDGQHLDQVLCFKGNTK
jgi:hypothetical protein